MCAALDIVVLSPLWEKIAAETIAGRALTACRRAVGDANGAQVTLALCDDAEMRTHNRAWRGIDKPTNVLSFPTAEGPLRAQSLGDIVVAFETVAREAADAGRAIEDHFAHMVVHGFLHLVGYDHLDDAEAETMERMERDILATIGVADPYGAEQMKSSMMPIQADPSP